MKINREKRVHLMAQTFHLDTQENEWERVGADWKLIKVRKRVSKEGNRLMNAKAEQLARNLNE